MYIVNLDKDKLTYVCVCVYVYVYVHTILYLLPRIGILACFTPWVDTLVVLYTIVPISPYMGMKSFTCLIVVFLRMVIILDSIKYVIEYEPYNAKFTTPYIPF